MSSLSRGAPLARYFTHPRAFPLLLLPWWLEGSIRASPSREFQRDLVYSSVNGYYAVRLIDDLMDGDKPPPREVIPALQFFHTEFERTYTRYFPFDHPFWEAFIDGWVAGADAASRDAGLEMIDEERFVQISAKKTVGARVPLAAVCHRYGRTELLEPWYGFVELFGAWHQMLNDMVGWNGDLDAGRTTYFLSQARASTRSTDSIAEWVVGEGLSWGRSQLRAWMDKLAVAARGLECPPLVAYVAERQTAIEVEWQRLIPDLAALSRLASVMR
ncbi:MAG: hypothetical protein ABIZ52_01510 [Candidatus Limnocylindrales bacterium]